MTTLSELLASLSDGERDFIANLDNGQEVDEHRQQLDVVIANDGRVDLDSQFWNPYEVIELGKNCLSEGHEREFVACNGIVLLNISNGIDICNEVDWVFSNFLTCESKLDRAMVALITDLANAAYHDIGTGL